MFLENELNFDFFNADAFLPLLPHNLDTDLLPFMKLDVFSEMDCELSTYTRPYFALYSIESKSSLNIIYPMILSRMHMSPSHYTRRSGWECYQLIYTHSGSGALNLNHTIYPLLPSTFCLIDCRVHHYFYANSPEGWEYSFIHFDGGGMNHLYKKVAANSIVQFRTEASTAYKLYKELMDWSHEDREDYELLFNSHMTQILTDLSIRKSFDICKGISVPTWLSPVQTYLIENYNKEIKIAELAKMCFLSSSRFAHRFAEIIGVPPIEYQYRIRIDNAKDYLINTQKPIDEICGLVGFNNISNFYMKFKRAVGISPAAYRKKFQKVKSWE